jgi:hypothetical protein
MSADTFVKQLVQILVHGDGLRNIEESLAKGCAGDPPLGWK